jgi:hypothetical protein
MQILLKHASLTEEFITFAVNSDKRNEAQVCHVGAFGTAHNFALYQLSQL